MKAFKNGLITGLILQAAIGPISFFVIQLTLQGTIFDGLAGVLAVTFVDYLYITLAVLGIGKVLEYKKVKIIFGMISSIVLMLFGAIIIKGIFHENVSFSAIDHSVNLISSFSSAFFITIFNPLTIVSFTSLFTTKAVEYNYTKKELYFFGFGTGFATILVMSSLVILFSFIGNAIPSLLVQILNGIVGCLLIGYGGIRFVKGLKK